MKAKIMCGGGARRSIELKPFMFFDCNPGLDISDAE
jgi:hypothetical protein